MAANAPERWGPTEKVETGPLEFVDAAVRAAGVDARRLRSGSGRYAILLPANELAHELLSATGISPAVTHVLFVDPVETEVVTGLLDVIGEPARSVRLAVAGAAVPAGLTADAGQVDVGPAPAAGFRLYRVVGDAPRIAPGPRFGESSDVTGERARWFDARHGGPDG